MCLDPVINTHGCLIWIFFFSRYKKIPASLDWYCVALQRSGSTSWGRQQRSSPSSFLCVYLVIANQLYSCKPPPAVLECVDTKQVVFICHSCSLGDHLKCLTTQVGIHPFTHTFLHWWQRLPGKAPPADQDGYVGCRAHGPSHRPSNRWTTPALSKSVRAIWLCIIGSISCSLIIAIIHKNTNDMILLELQLVNIVIVACFLHIVMRWCPIKCQKMMKSVPKPNMPSSNDFFS